MRGREREGERREEQWDEDFLAKKELMFEVVLYGITFSI